MKHTFTQITERFKKHRKRRDLAFYKLSESAEELNDLIEDQKVFLDVFNVPFSKHKIAQTRRLSRNNYVVNMVTALEVGLKQIILETSHWDDSGLSKLLVEQKLNLSDTYELFGKHRVSREFMLCQTTSFQSLQSIERVFGHLTNTTKFLKVVEAAKFRKESPDNLKEMIPHWYQVVKATFEVRNAFVHEGKVSAITWSDAEVIGDTLFCFYHAIYDTTLNLLLAKKGDKQANSELRLEGQTTIGAE